MESADIMRVITQLLKEIDPEEVPINAAGMLGGLDPSQALNSLLTSMVGQSQSVATSGFDMTQLVSILEGFINDG